MTRRFFSMFLFLGVVLAPSLGRAAMSDVIDVTLYIRDEQGRALPYATVWGYLLPRANPLAINADDLWRVTTRYQSSFDFALEVSNKRPVPYLNVYPMGNKSGQFHHKIDYRFEEGSAAKRPDKMSLGFTVMKRGYLPARIDFAVTNESVLSGEVTLKRDSKSTIESQPYLVAFERLRYELSDPRRNEDISEKNRERIEGLRKELEATAQQALGAGDKKAAARIYARMEFLPSIRVINGKPAGFSQSDPSSAQSRAYLAKAYSLDPTNPYIAAEVIFDEGAEHFGGNKYSPEKATDEQRRAFAEYLGRLHAFIRANGAELWPDYHKLYALWLRKSSDPKERERVMPLLEELYRAEPKYQTRERLLQVR